MNTRHGFGVAALAATALGLACAQSACVDAAEGRAERDRTIGRASLEAFSVTATDGAAAVRSLESTGATYRLAAWAAAPTVELALRAPAGSRVELALENTLADAVVTATSAGEPVALEGSPVAGAGAQPTERRVAFAWPDGAAEVQVRVAAPDAASAEPFRVAAFADVQEAIDRVHEIYARMRQDPSVRFALVSGDLTEQGSEEELERFRRELKALPVPVFMTLGNHELGTRDDLYQSFYGRVNHSFTFHGARFTMLDSSSATIDPLAYEWLAGWLRDGREQFHLISMHIPPVDPVGTRNGSFANRAEAHKLFAMMAEGGVDVALYGHVHSYYAYSNAGIPSYISGGGGAIPERLDGIGRHYLTFDVDPAKQLFQTGLVRVD